MTSPWRDLAGRALRVAARRLASSSATTTTRTAPVPTPTVRPGPPGGRHLDYSPDLDGRADPGEVVWAWVAYEEDAGQGKDRPVLVVGREGTRCWA